MITTQNVIEWSKPHPSGIEDARQTRIYNDNIEVSIVGGGKGLYGDFEDNFEIAIFDKETKEFVTRFYAPESNDDVMGYVDGPEMQTLLNQLFSKGFQVR